METAQSIDNLGCIPDDPPFRMFLLNLYHYTGVTQETRTHFSNMSRPVSLFITVVYIKGGTGTVPFLCLYYSHGPSGSLDGSLLLI